ncbi:Uncharacterised protein [Sphingobacterium mizutaii]|uniref:Uncharacterized protein n=1 Tax=Sphingobacterium mizutaii TaxID=1010 RepID=A0AAJ4XEP3_9SPHI|nr:hypothetical protein SAMN05192578_10419 [Sphingobacterium mizutaii]SNV60136.1 Uncharacterised protein [Sphingobacterium mizutaii]
MWLYLSEKSIQYGFFDDASNFFYNTLRVILVFLHENYKEH